MLQVRSLSWKSEVYQEDHHTTSPLPHSIFTIIADVDATLADHHLTLHELRAILRMVIIRTSWRSRGYAVCPVSTYMKYLEFEC